MTNHELQDKIYSNDYFDAIVPVSIARIENFLKDYAFLDAQLLCALYGVLHLPVQDGALPNGIGYSQIPKLYTTLDTESLEVSGILRVQAQPSLGYRGENVLLGFIDTGIDYTLDAFRRPDGRTRILGIWDQTLPSDAPPYDMGYGTAYRADDIDRALQSENPYDVVPQRDTDGHGTFLAGVAAGSADTAYGFSGAAPMASIAMVKLKSAKQNLRDYFLIRDDAAAYQETDIMMGVRYLLALSQTYGMPLVICLGLGTNQGDHAGNSPLERELSFILDYPGNFCCVASGNETGRGHHCYYALEPGSPSQDVEILVDEDTDGFSLEIWADAPDLLGVSLLSPLGERVERIAPRLGAGAVVNFVAERTVLQVNYEIAEYASGTQLIFLRFLRPTPGVWRIGVSGNGELPGSFHMWLPITGFLSPGTVFLNPNPYTTLTCPSTSEGVVTVANYSAYTGSLAIDSGRGYTRTGGKKPDLAAPGVDVTGPATNAGSSLPPLNKYTRRSGTSVSCAITVGAIALLLNWNMDRPAPQLLTSRTVKDYLHRGAVRQPGLTYPNREWGYGALNLYRVFETLM